MANTKLIESLRNRRKVLNDPDKIKFIDTIIIALLDEQKLTDDAQRRYEKEREQHLKTKIELEKQKGNNRFLIRIVGKLNLFPKSECGPDTPNPFC